MELETKAFLWHCFRRPTTKGALLGLLAYSRHHICLRREAGIVKGKASGEHQMFPGKKRDIQFCFTLQYLD